MNWLKKNFRDVGKYKVHKYTGYKIHRGFIKLICVLILTYVSFVFVWSMTHERYYVACDEPQGCFNAFYGATCKNCRIPQYLFEKEYLEPGFRAGYNPSFLFKDAVQISMLFAFLMISLHHYLYNRNFKGA